LFYKEGAKLKDRWARQRIEERANGLEQELEDERSYRQDTDKELRELNAQLGRLEIKHCKKCKHLTPHWRSHSGWEDFTHTCLVCGKEWHYYQEEVAEEVKADC
jgi:hypothetical protein